MNRITNTVGSIVRYFMNMARRKLIKNPRIKKKLSVAYHNSRCILDYKKSYNEELFDYELIINGKQNFYCQEYYYGNAYYGHAAIIKQYAGYKGKVNACIEHGVYFGDTVFYDESIDSGLNGLITFGDKRLEHLNNIASIPVIAIGPYIHYAEPLLSGDEIKRIKQQNGKTLLVFPTHSIDRVETEFDFEAFNVEIQRVISELNIRYVMICLFYKDIGIGRDKYYKDQGYQVVCSGYRCDPSFLRRLKTFILLSDFTMSNDIGTNIGYSIYLDRPHYIYKQKLKYNAYTSMDMENVIQSDAREEETLEIRNAFSEILEEITPLQREICNKYWGTKYIRPKEELYEILAGFE